MDGNVTLGKLNYRRAVHVYRWHMQYYVLFQPNTYTVSYFASQID